MNTLVSFELAKLLKEKGFEGTKSPLWYYKDGTLHETSTKGYKGLKSWNTWEATQGIRWDAPTISEVVMWLYEKHGVWINAWSDTNLDLPEWKTTAKWFYVVNCDLSDSYNPQTGKPKQLFNSPTEAYEAGIEYTLNILI